MAIRPPVAIIGRSVQIGPTGSLGVHSGGCPNPHLGLWRLALVRTLPASPCVDAHHRTEGEVKAYPVLYHEVHPLSYVCTSHRAGLTSPRQCHTRHAELAPQAARHAATRAGRALRGAVGTM